MDPQRQPPVSPATCPGGAMPVGAVVHMRAGEHRMLVPGRLWRVYDGLLGVRTGAAAPDMPMALLGPSGLVAPMQPMSVQALQPLSLLSQPWPPPLERLPPGWWQAPAHSLQGLQWQSAQWAWCRQHHSPVARSASWSLLALAFSRMDRLETDVPMSNGPGYRLQEPRLHASLRAAPVMQWPVTTLLLALGQSSAVFEEVLLVLGRAGAWQPLPTHTASDGSVRMDTGSSHASRHGPYPRALVFGSEASLQAQACDCHRPLIEALQASASASATLMPSTPADRIPPA